MLARSSVLVAVLLSSSFSAQTTRQAPSSVAGPQRSVTPSRAGASRGEDPGLFLPDPHQGGRASLLRVVELRWGRLVDVHELGPDGELAAVPTFRDFVVGEAIQGDGVDYELATHPVTGRAKLTILRPRGPEFFALLAAAEAATIPIAPKGPDAPGPFSFVPRNGTLVLRLDDLLDDDSGAAAELSSTVRLLTGVPSVVPFQARLSFDPNHGGLAAGLFHSTRVLVDLTVSEVEALDAPVPLPLNQLGLPASRPANARPNVLLAIPTQLSFADGQFELLRNLAGNPLGAANNGPVNASSPTRDVVRAARSGNAGDMNRGFLLDLEAPELIATWPLEILDATLARAVRRTGAPRPAAREPGPPTFELDLRFLGVCKRRLEPEQVLVAGATFLAVVDPGNGPDAGGTVTGVLARHLAGPVPDAAALLGAGLLVSTYEPALRVPARCWFGTSPGDPMVAATGSIPTATTFLARFSEPMSPEISAADDFRLLRGPAGTAATAESTVVGAVLSSPALDSFQLVPILPLAHKAGESEPYALELVAGEEDCNGITDLAGNALLRFPAPTEYRVASTEPTERTGGRTLRFAGADELAPLGFADLRGQVFYNLSCGTLRPRPVTHRSFLVDASNPVPSLMIPFPPGVQEPLNPLGAKLQSLWRYADLGWALQDESLHNLDVEGLWWSPAGGVVVADFFEQFEIRLAHSVFLPDEDISIFSLLPKYPGSGLPGPPATYDGNVLSPSGGGGQEVVHPRALGYRVDPSDLFVAPTGTKLMPYPLNKSGGPYRTYVWRDTGVVERAAPGGAGVPLDIETGPPLELYAAGQEGTVFGAGRVRTIGLPLLMEFRCFPSDTGLGLNPLAVALAINSSANPHFRALSAGGVDRNGNVVPKNPDLEPVPTGAFNPVSLPPGRPSRPVDNVSYRGQVDVVVRVSRAHTAWIDTGLSAPDYVPPVVEAFTPEATRILLDFRGAVGFAGPSNPFDAEQIDAYGAVRQGGVSFLGGSAAWSQDISAADGARYLQVRVTFLNDVARGLSPELDTLGLAFGAN